MHVLHYSFSLSACPKCHLLVCQHTSLANLDLNPNENISPCQLNRGMNLYLLPTSTTSDQNYSWTTSGTNSNSSVQTIDQCSSDNETICDNIPFADEHIVKSNSSSMFRPKLNNIVRTQSERYPKDFKPRISMTKSLSYSTIYNKSSSTSSPSWQRNVPIGSSPSTVHSSSLKSFLILLLLILSFLITNTIDIVLVYIYYQKNWKNFLLILIVLLICDMIFWLNHFIEYQKDRSRILYFPLTIRFYLLYQLIDSMTFLFEKNFIQSTRSSSTTTLDTRLSPTIDSQPNRSKSNQIDKRLRQRIFHHLTLFYLIHSSFQSMMNFYLWTNQFDLTTKFWFLPLWENSVGQRTIRFWSTTTPIDTDDVVKPLARRTLTSNWTNSFIDPTMSSSSSSFVLTSIFYHLIVNYSFLSIFIEHIRYSFLLFLSTVARFWLIIIRLYAFLFLLRFNSIWFSISFLILHLSLATSLFFDRSTNRRERRFLRILLAIFTTNSIDDRSIDVLISLENISIFLHRIYFENFPSTFFIFLIVLIVLQFFGFLFDSLTKQILRHRLKKIEVKV